MKGVDPEGINLLEVRGRGAKVTAVKGVDPEAGGERAWCIGHGHGSEVVDPEAREVRGHGAKVTAVKGVDPEARGERAWCIGHGRERGGP